MTASTVFHRRYLRFTPPQVISDMANDHGWFNMNVDTMAQQYLDDRSYAAWLITDAGLKPIRIVPQAGQIFQLAATAFELDWSGLCRAGGFEPVVDDSYSVVGHTGWVGDAAGNIFVQKASQNTPLREIIKAALPAVVSRSNPATTTYAEHAGYSDNSWNVLTDPDGTILLVLGVHDRGGDMEPAIDPFVLIGLGQIAVAVGKGVGKYLVRRIVTSAGTAGKAIEFFMAASEPR